MSINYGVNPGPPVYIGSWTESHKVMIVNTDDVNTVIVADVPSFSPRNGVPIKPNSFINWTGRGPLYARVDNNVTDTIVIAVSVGFSRTG